MTGTTTDQKQAIRDYLTSLNLTYQATFQPTPQPADKVKHPQLHWLITLTRGRATMQCPYTQGVGHVKGYQQFYKTPYDRRIAEEAQRRTCETGKLWKRMASCDYWMVTKDEQPAPDVLDVLYCLILDADVLNYPSYEQWGREFGYDADSRKGEKIYRLCLKQSLELKNLIGFQGLENLTELYQGY